jgi:hypothetical protein
VTFHANSAGTAVVRAAGWQSNGTPCLDSYAPVSVQNPAPPTPPQPAPNDVVLIGNQGVQPDASQCKAGSFAIKNTGSVSASVLVDVELYSSGGKNRRLGNAFSYNSIWSSGSTSVCLVRHTSNNHEHQ